MRQRLLRLLHTAVDHPRTVLLCAVLLTVASAAAVPGLRIQAGHKALSDADSPHVKRLDAFLKDFGSPNQLVAMVEGGDEALRREVVDRLAAELPAPAPLPDDPPACDPEAGPHAPGCVNDLAARVQPGDLEQWGLLYLEPDQVDKVARALDRDTLGVGLLTEIHGLQSLFETLAEGFEERAEEAVPEEGTDRAGQVMDGVTRFFEVLAERLEHPERMDTPLDEALLEDREMGVEQVRGVDAEGYFSSHDGRIKLTVIRPVHTTDKPRPVLAFVRYVERHAERIAEEVGAACEDSACPDGTLEVRFTGLPALIADETRTLNRDVAFTGLIAFLGIAALFAFGFRSLKSAVLGLGPLVMALAWTLAFVRFAFGSLNLVTASFVATLLGLGIDFAVHILARFQEARRDGADLRRAVDEAVLGAGPGVLTGGITTAGAFFALAPTDFKAFSELGVMTGVGLILALLATLVVMPALLVMPKLRGLQGAPPGERRGLMGRLPEVVVQHPWIFALAGVVVAVLMGLQGRDIHWNYDYTALMPDDMPSVQAWTDLREHTDYSAEVAAVTADSREEAERLAAELATKPTVDHVESIAGYLPSNQQAKLEALRPLAKRVDRDEEAGGRDAPNREEVVEALQAIQDVLVDVRFEAKRGGADEDAALLDAPIEAVGHLKEVVRGLPQEEAEERLSRLQDQVLALRDRALKAVRTVSAGEPLTGEELLAKLPGGVADRLQGNGRYAIYVYPAEDIGDRDFRERFVADLRDVSETATGFPVTHWESIQSIERGFRQASLLALLAVIVLLLIDFRSFKDTAMALLPLAMGVVWAWGGMGVLGMTYNPANIIAFPLIVGIGVDTGVHILHRYHQEQEGDVAAVVRHTGHAIFLSTATTMVGFGSLALADHVGMSSLGVVLLLGVGACLLASTLVLPSILRMAQLLARRGGRGGGSTGEAR
ncbi:MAG: MMPL family transporter [Myxococcota bacterium]